MTPNPQPRPQGLPPLIHLVQLAAGKAVRPPRGLLDLRLHTQSTCECSPEEGGSPREAPSSAGHVGNTLSFTKCGKGNGWVCHLSFYREGGEAEASSSRRSWSEPARKQTWRICLFLRLWKVSRKRLGGSHQQVNGITLGD